MKRRILLIALALMLALSLCACGQSVMKADFTAPESITAPRTLEGGSSFAMQNSMAEAEAPEEKSVLTDTAAGAEETPALQSEKIIYSVNLSMETTQFDETLASFEAAVNACGGYTMYSDVSGNTNYEADGSARLVNRGASYTVCIPAEKLDAFLSEASTYGNVTSTNKSAENVTSRYTDFETRKNSLLTEETRLLELLEKADNVESLIALENRLSEVRYQIETIQSSLNDLDRRIAYSTVSLYLQEVRGYRANLTVTQSFGERLADAFSNGWNNFVDALEDFAVGMAEGLIPLSLLVITLLVIVIVVRRKIKKSRAKRAEQPTDTPE